jgi:hypothetical protein
VVRPVRQGAGFVDGKGLQVTICLSGDAMIEKTY